MGFFRKLIGMDEQDGHFTAPDNRKSLFGLMLKEKLLYMIPLNVIYFVFLIPCIAWMIYCIAGIEQQINMGLSMYSQEVLGWFNIFALGFIPCSAVIGLGNAGIARVMRNWARDEHAFILADFLDSLKKNWKQSVLLAVITGVIPLIVYWYAGFIIMNPQYLGIIIIPVIFTGLLILLWLMSLGSMYVQAVTYNLKLNQIIKNGFIMNLAHFLTGLVLLIAELIIPAVFVFVMTKIPELGILFMTVWYLIFGFSFGWLIKASYANRLCEEFINSKAGLETGIGLRKE